MEAEIISSLVSELRRGTLILLVLSQLQSPAYGYRLVQTLQQHGIPIEANTLYPLMRRLESQGLLRSTWETAAAKPRKYYALTPEGERVLDAAKAQWLDFCTHVNRLLEEENHATRSD